MLSKCEAWVPLRLATLQYARGLGWLAFAGLEVREVHVGPGSPVPNSTRLDLFVSGLGTPSPNFGWGFWGRRLGPGSQARGLHDSTPKASVDGAYFLSPYMNV